MYCVWQSELKAKWEEEKAALQKSRNDAEEKYNEINEQVIENIFYDFKVFFICFGTKANFFHGKLFDSITYT